MAHPEDKSPSGVFVHRLTDNDHKRAAQVSEKIERMKKEFESQRSRWRGTSSFNGRRNPPPPSRG